MALYKYVFIIIILITTDSCIGHKNIIEHPNSADSLAIPPPPPFLSGKSYDKYLKNYDCVYNGKLNPKERLLKFPFNKASHIFIVSFHAVKVKMNDNTCRYGGGIPKKDSLIDFSSFKEIIELNRGQVDSLSAIIFNFNYKKNEYLLLQHSSCFLPSENAILFVDEKKNCYAQIELCFGCRDYVLTPPSMKFGDFCTEKMKLIRDFFIHQGITYGLDAECGRSESE